MKAMCYAWAVLAICLSACSCQKVRDLPAGKSVSASVGETAGEESRPAAAPVLIDTRSPQEYAAGHLEGARLMPVDAIGSLIEAQVPDKRTRIQLYCRSGGRSELARQTLADMGYTNAVNLGGLQAAADQLHKKVVQ